MPRLGHALLPVDRWVAFFNAFALIAWSPHLRHPVGALVAALHAAALALPLLLAHAPRLSRPVAMLREVYPLLFVSAFWSTLGFRHPFVSTAPNDAAVVALDRWLFGAHPNLTWVAAMPHPLVSETMQGFYFAYYLLLVGIPLVLLLSGCRATVRELTLRLAVTYLGCFMVYLVFPVVGPLDLFPRFAGTFTAGPFYQLNHGVHGSAANSLGTAFPSSHTAGAITFAWVAWRRCGRPLAWLATLVAVMVALATVYTQNHFVVDTIAGAALALGLQRWVVPALRCSSTRAGAPRREHGTFVLFPAREGAGA